MGVLSGVYSSFARSHLWRLFPGLSRVDDEFERVGILVLLHQLEVYQPFGICYQAFFPSKYSLGVEVFCFLRALQCLFTPLQTQPARC